MTRALHVGILIAALTALAACSDTVVQTLPPSDAGQDAPEDSVEIDAAGSDDADSADAAVSEDADAGQGEDVGLDVPGEDAGGDVEEDVPDPPGPRAVEPPPPPERDGRVHTISVAIRTASGATAGTDDGVELCVGARCFGLDTPDINDREPGKTEVIHLTGLDLDPADLDSVTLATTSTEANNDRWTPACLDLRFDGEPVYCEEIPVHIGTGDSADEVPSWTDPAGLHEGCTTCQRDVLTHGPLLGPPGADSVRVWVRTDATRLTGLRLGTSRDLTDAPVVAWAWPEPSTDFTAILVAPHLAPDTQYFYRVEVDGDTSEPVRAVRTAPAPDQRSPTRISFGSCSRLEDQPIFTPILAGQPDLFIFIGDNNYANTHYREALRWHYRLFRGLRERAELVANTPTLAIWDDHDFLANNSNGTCLDRDKALGAFREYWANPAMGTPDTPGVFFSYRWGAVELFMLDCRMYRPDVGDGGLRCEPDPAPPQLDILDGPLGPAQERWLLEGLAASDATFKLVGCGSRFTPDGSTDSWASFPEAFERLTDAIDADGVGGVVFLSGDIHRSMFKWVPASAYDIPEITSSPLAYVEPASCSVEPNMITCFDATDSWVELDIDPTVADPTLTARLRDVGGEVIATWTIRRSELE